MPYIELAMDQVREFRLGQGLVEYFCVKHAMQCAFSSVFIGWTILVTLGSGRKKKTNFD